MINVVVCVCTRNRPKMLQECLATLSVQDIDEEKYSMSIVVVENNFMRESQGIVEQAAKNSPFQIAYVHERDIGIASARNRSVSEAMARFNADFVAMIDDDEFADSTWLAGLLDTQEKYQADIVVGDVIEIFPTTKWKLPRKLIGRDKIGCKYASTNCTLFKCEIFKKYRFNVDYNLSGGSDTELTTRVARDGGLIVRTSNAQVFETIPEERCTLKWHWERAYRVEAVNTRIAMELDGPLKTVPRRVLKFFTQCAKGIIKTVIAGITLSPRRWLKAMRNFAHAAGIIAGLLDFMPTPYRNTTGY